MKKIIIYSALLFSMSILAYSCKKNDTDNNNSGEGKMEVRMTDAPGPYQAVYVDVIGVEINTSSGWKALTTYSGIYNLLDYRFGIDTLLSSGIVSSGRIEEIRLVLGNRNTVVIDSVTYPLETPSAQQSGLKIKVHADIVSGQTYTVLLDFDAAKSIVETGSGKYILKPVIRSILEINNGIITGKLDSSAAGFQVYAINGNDSIGSIVANNGDFYIGGLASGTYEVHIISLPPYDKKIITNVNVSTGQKTDLGPIKLDLL